MTTVLYIVLTLSALVCALQALRVRRLLMAALWLAGSSALLAVIFYLMGAYEVAVIELSVGAGLVTVLFVFAISIAGKDIPDMRRVVSKRIVIGLVCLTLCLLFSLTWTFHPPLVQLREAPFAETLWVNRALDVLTQVVLIFAGTLGILGLLAPDRRTGKRTEPNPAAAGED